MLRNCIKPSIVAQGHIQTPEAERHHGDALDIANRQAEMLGRRGYAPRFLENMKDMLLKTG